jgi:hypothetical protein
MRLILACYFGLLAALTAVALLGGVMLLSATGPDNAVEDAADDHGYDFALWELRNFPRKWIYKLHNLFDTRSAERGEETVRRYFGLTDEIAALESADPDGERLRQARAERDAFEADVEDILERRMTAVLEYEGLALEPPLFSDLGLIFPPVDFELDAPPRVLAVSPRDRIALVDSYLLEPGLQREQFGGIEGTAESDNEGGEGVSALVVGTGGVATYPSVLSAEDSYEELMDTAFHEWLHHYLAFFPLGRSYFEGGDVKTLNESVASIGGRELAARYFERYGGVEDAPAPAPVPDSEQPAFDFTEEMRALRREVEALLDDGKVAEAEALMEERRLRFVENGYQVRKINQAYFAFHGFYAFSAGSIDPIGPMLQTLFELEGSPGAFLRAVRGITSREELDQAVAGAGG